MKQFQANDGPNLNKQDMNVLVTNIKYQLRNQMGLEKVQPSTHQKRENDNQKGTNPKWVHMIQIL